jgi:hypothetical protein
VKRQIEEEIEQELITEEERKGKEENKVGLCSPGGEFTNVKKLLGRVSTHVSTSYI